MGSIEDNFCYSSIGACLLLSVFYVGSLYVWGPHVDRNDTTIICKRTVSVFFVTLVSPFVTKMFLVDETFTSVSIWEVLGFRTEGFIQAATIPLILTAILFLGPLVLHEWGESFKFNAPFFRNMIIAPISEEITFRACMMPLLVQKGCMKPLSAVFVCPLFFGLAHVHHIIEMQSMGFDLRSAVMMAAFQFFYTTLFGAYSALLFIKTGHVVAPLFAHAFCNMMGFPDFNEVLESPNPRKIILGLVFVLGLVLWCVLLPILTNHTLYANHLYEKIQ